jgi:hypothetical protein
MKEKHRVISPRTHRIRRKYEYPDRYDHSHAISFLAPGWILEMVLMVVMGNSRCLYDYRWPLYSRSGPELFLQQRKAISPASLLYWT